MRIIFKEREQFPAVFIPEGVRGFMLEKGNVAGHDHQMVFGHMLKVVLDESELILAKSDIMNEIKMVQVGTSDYQELITLHGGTSGWVAETGTRSETGTPLLRNCKPTWGELYAYPRISEHSAQDIFFNVENWLMEDISDGMAVALSTAVHSGDGSNLKFSSLLS